MADGYAGSVRISTKLDNSGIGKDLKKIGQEIGSKTKEFERLANSVSKSEAKINELKRSFDQLAKGDKQAGSLTALESQLRRIVKETKEVEKENKELIASYDQAVQHADSLRSAGFTPDQMAGAVAEVDRLSAQLQPVWDKLNGLEDRAEGFREKIAAVKMNPELSVEAQNLIGRIDLLENGLSETVDRANAVKNTLQSLYSQQIELDKSPFERALDGVEQGAAAISAELQRQQFELQNLSALYDKAEAQMQSAISSGNAAAQALAQSNMDKLSSDIDRVQGGIESLNYDANRLKVNINQLALDPANADEAERLGSRVADVAQSLTRSINESTRLNKELHGTFEDANKDTKAANKGFSNVASAIKNTGDNARISIPHIRKLGTTSKSAGKSASNAASGFVMLGNRIRRLVGAAFVFNVIRSGLSSLQQGLGEVLKQNTRFMTSLNNIKVNLLTAFAPIWEVVLPALLRLMSTLERVTYSFATFVAGLFGKSYSQARDSAQAIYNQSKATEDAAIAARNKAEADRVAAANAKKLEDAEKALAKAEKKRSDAQEKVNERFLAGFDEIQQSPAQDDLLLADAEYQDALDKLQNLEFEIAKIEEAQDRLNFDFDTTGMDGFLFSFEDLANRLYGVGQRIAETINGFLSGVDWGRIQQGARDIANAIAQFLNGAIDHLNWPLIGYSLGQGINTILNFADQFIRSFHWQTLALGLANGLNSMVSTINWDLLAQVLYGGLNSLFGSIYSFMTTVDWGRIGSQMTGSLNTTIANINWDLIGRTFASKWSALVDFLYSFVTQFDWVRFGKSLSTAVNGWFAQIDWSKAGKTLSEGVKGLLDSLLAFVQGIDWYAVGRAVGDFLANIDWKGILEKIGQLVISILGGIFSAVWAALGADAKDVEKAFQGLVGWLEKNRETIGKVIEVVLKLIAAFVTIVTTVKAVNSIISIAKVAIAALTSPVGLVVAAIVALIAIIVLLVKNWDAVKDAARRAVEGIKNAWNSVANWFKEKVIEPIKRFFTGLWDGIANAAKKVVDTVKNLFSGLTKSAASTQSAVSNVSGGSRSAVAPMSASVPDLPLLSRAAFSTLYSPDMPVLTRGSINIPAPHIAASGAVANRYSSQQAATAQDIAGLIDKSIDSKLSGLSSPQRNVEVTMQINKDVIGRVVAPLIDKEKQIIGGFMGSKGPIRSY